MQTWGIDIEKIEASKGGEGLPVGHYTMEIAATETRTNRKGEEYLGVYHTVLDAPDSALIGRKHFQYVSFDPERFAIAKGDFLRMGVPEAALKNNGSPDMMVGTVFECDLVQNSGGFINMRNIQAKTQEQPAAPAQPAPQRAPTGRR